MIDRPIVTIPCGECEESLEPYHPAILFDGEWCHLHCVVDAEDNIGFDDFFGNNS